MNRCALILAVFSLVTGASSQLASSEICQIETCAFTGGGGFSLSSDHLMWSALEPTTPLTSGAVTVHSGDHAVQPGLIPSLYPRKRLGDTTCDDSVDAADIVRAANYFNEPFAWPLTIEQLFNADVNFDMKISSEDLEGIAEIIIGLR